jgi:hypothetical protein
MSSCFIRKISTKKIGLVFLGLTLFFIINLFNFPHFSNFTDQIGSSIPQIQKRAFPGNERIDF